MAETEGKLKREVGLAAATSLVVGCVIGAGVFFKPYAIYQATGGAPGMGILAWVIGGLMSVFGALTFAELSLLFPQTGGMMTYLSKGFSERIGFLAGWMQVAIFYPSFLAGYGVKVGEELSEYFGGHFALPISLLVIAVLAAVNILGTRHAGRMQVTATVCKLVPLFVLIVFGFLWGSGASPVLSPLVGEGKSAGSVLGTTLLAVLFAFEGWTNVGAVAGEMKRPEKDLPKAIIGGVLIIMAVYLLINIAYLRVIPAQELMNLESPAAAVAVRLFGPRGGMLVKTGIIISVIGAGNGFLMAGSRVAYQMAEQGMLPGSKKLAALNGSKVPSNAILLVSILACLYSFSGEFDLLTDLGVFSCWVFYTLTFACVMYLRRTHPEWVRKYKVPGYPLVPVIAVFSGLYVVASQLFWSGRRGLVMSVCSVVVTLIGLPLYRKGNSR